MFLHLQKGVGENRHPVSPPDFCRAGVEVPCQGEGPTSEGLLSAPAIWMHGGFSPEDSVPFSRSSINRPHAGGKICFPSGKRELANFA